MSLAQFLSILRARWKTAFATLLVVVLGTVAVSLTVPERYSAITSLVVDFKGMDPILGIMLPAQMMPGYMATQVDIIRSRKVAVDVVRTLKMTGSADVRQQWLRSTEGKGTIEDWLANLLLGNLDVKPSRDSSVIYIQYEAVDPKFAAIIADTFAAEYIKTNLDLRVQPARQSAEWFNEQLGSLRENLEKSQGRLAQYQSQKGITATDARLDLETGRLAELSGQYTAAQGMGADALSRQRQLKEFLARGADPSSLPDILANPLVQNLKAGLAQSEARLQQISSQLGRNHPEVKRIEADILQQKQRLREEITAVAAGISNVAGIAQKRQSELAVTLAQQKARLLRLNQDRDQLAVLVKDAETAQRAYDTAAQRFTQTNLESQSSQTNIAILTNAVPPIRPSFPNWFLNLSLALAVGSILGIGLVLLVEMLDQRVRSTEDLLTAFDFPVLASLEKGITSRRRLRLMRLKARPAKLSVAAPAS